MESYPGSDEVLADLGDKVIGGISLGVARAAKDLAEYRRLKPGGVARHSKRGLAGWIHDAVWHYLSMTLDGIPEVTLLDQEPHREVFVGIRYRMRVKRHFGEGAIRTYPTQGALDFYLQPPQLPGLEEIRLTAGYRWRMIDRMMGAAVLSLRDGLDNVIWVEELPPPAAGMDGVQSITPPPATGPKAPVIDVEGEGGDEPGEESALS